MQFPLFITKYPKLFPQIPPLIMTTPQIHFELNIPATNILAMT
jgi:hypothetical protein